MAFIYLSGTKCGVYGGDVLADDCTSAATAAGAVRSSGKPFTLDINTTGVDNAGDDGIDISYSQVPCS